MIFVRRLHRQKTTMAVMKAYAGMTTVGSAAIPVLLACLFVLVPLISSCGERGHVKPMGPQ
ncbi:MAG: hypothetical protein JWO89_722, partial [Verrucomicrobiaceae bacterium]|nr:hypothetical protein [Verrucomicrobiaceae bacterium]